MLLGTGLSAAAQTIVSEQPTPWDNKSYTWVDANGESHTSLLTDKATDPDQIMALFNAVYTDPTVPGLTRHNEYLTDGTFCTHQLYQRVINYDDHAHTCYNYSIGTRDDTYNPNWNQERARQDEWWTTNGSSIYGVRADNFCSKVFANPELYLKPDGFEWESEQQKINTNQYTNYIYAWRKVGQIYPPVFEWLYIDWINPANTPVPQPVDGMTILLVEVKDTWEQNMCTPQLGLSGNSRPFIEKALKSVQVMTQWLRVEDELNPGYIFLVDEFTTNRFFFLSKGRARRSAARRTPFFGAFEQISPREVNISAVNLLNGDVERVEHDCYSVFQGGGLHHYVQLDDGESSALSNLALFMPDKRFRGVNYKPGEPFDQSNVADYDGWYNFADFQYQYPVELYTREQDELLNRFRPGMLLYTAQLSATATPSATSGFYDITLDWNTSFRKEKIYTSVEEQFYVYVLDPDGQWQLLSTIPAAAAAGMGETTRAKTFTYPWPQTEQSQQFTYLVTANPIDHEGENLTVSNIFVNTNTATVAIPGLSELFTNNVGDYRSRFALDSEHLEMNVYRNRPVLTLNRDDVDTEAAYSLRRIALDENNSEISDTEVATVQFSQTADGSFDYEVNYVNQVLEPRFDAETSTELNATGTDFRPGASIQFVDRFTASTQTNSHPAGYTYVLRNRQGSAVSNTYAVPVKKSTCEAGLAGFTQAEVLADDGHQLRENNEIWVDFQVGHDNERHIDKYDVHRVNIADPDAKNYHARIGKAEITNGNNIAQVGINHDTGLLSVDLGSTPMADAAGQKLRFYDDSDYFPFTEPEYVTEIFTTTRDKNNERVVNTYGTNISSLGMPQLTFETARPVRTKAFTQKGTGWRFMGYQADLILTPDLTQAGDINNVYYYRIWRVNDDGSETLLNGNTTAPVIYDENDEYHQGYGAKYDALEGYWKPANQAIYVVDNFEADAIPVAETETITDPNTGQTTTINRGGFKEVEYIARMYSTVEQPPTSAPNGRRESVTPHQDISSLYYVTEKRATVTFDYSDQTITGLCEPQPNVVARRYFNLFGHSASTPFNGINIVVTTLSDGTTTSRKQRF